jgi:hypothetical protein
LLVVRIDSWANKGADPRVTIKTMKNLNCVI